MLSPGESWKRVPTDLLGNMRFRRSILQSCQGNEANQAAIRDICRNDIIFWINTTCYQFNPNPVMEDVPLEGPFICWPFQVKALLSRDPSKPGILWCFEKKKTVVVEKSREIGASWLFLLFQTWLAQFRDNLQLLDISKTAEAVDDASRDSLFEKLRYVHERQPDWLKGEIDSQKMSFKFLRTRSEITGEASTGRAGVGGRASAIFIDEFSQIKEDTKVRQRTASTSNCRFFNGTHLGTGTEFFTLTQTPEITKIRWHWTQHPEKNRGLYSFDLVERRHRFWEYRPETDQIVELKDGPRFQYEPDFVFDRTGKPSGGPHPGIRSTWYDWKCIDIGNDRGVAMELDIDAAGAAKQFFDTMMIRSLQNRFCRPADWMGEIVFDRDTAQPIAFHELKDGPLKLWCQLVKGKPPPANYTAGADLSWGTGATNSTLTIFNGDLGERVGEYVTPFLHPQDFATASVAILRMFRNEGGMHPEFAWELQGPGVPYGKLVLKLGYENYYLSSRSTSIREYEAKTPGWTPGLKTKPALLEEYRSALKQHLFLNFSQDALEECLAFQFDDRGEIIHGHERNTGDPSGARAGHSDRVIADALAWKMAEMMELGLTRPKYIEPKLAMNTLAYRKRLVEDLEYELSEI